MAVTRSAYYLCRVRLSACITEGLTGQISVKFETGNLYDKLVERKQI